MSAIKKKPLAAFFIAFVLILSAASSLIFIGQENSQERKEDISEQSESQEREALPVIIIDAGHGGEDGGAIGIDGTLEKDLNLSVAAELAELFRADGYTVRLTRDEDILLYDRNSDYYGHKKEQDMAARLSICREYENAVFISIHMNSFSQSKYKGLQVYYSPLPEGARLAEKIQSSVAESLQPYNTRKTKPSGGNIYMLDKNPHPAVLVECGFLSNAEDCAALSDKNYRSRLCLTIFFAVDNYITEGD